MRAIFIKLLVKFISLMPLRLAQGIGKFLGLCLYWSPTQLRHNTRINIDLCWPTLSTNEKTHLVKESLINTGMSILETGAMLCWPRDKVLALIRSIEGEEALESASQLNKGIILLTPHLGCWEIAGLYIGHRYPSTILYKRPKIKALADWLTHARQRTGASLVATDELAARHLFRSLKQKKEIIGLLPDQEPPSDSGVFAPFFGMAANSMTLAVKLAKKTGAPIILGFAQRLKGGQGYKLIAIAPDSNIYDDDIAIATAAMNQAIEQCVRIAPEQYQWSYKRFRQRPDGSANPYK